MIGMPNCAPNWPGIGDRERAAVHFVRLELLAARALGDVGDRAAQAEQVLLVGVPDDRHDQPALERHGDPEVDVLLVDDVVAVERGVDDRDAGASASITALAMKAMYVSFAPSRSYSAFFCWRIRVDRREVDVEDRVHMRRRAPAEHHVLGDLLAHHRERLDLDAIAVAAGAAEPALCGVRAAAAPELRGPARGVALGHASAEPAPWSRDTQDVAAS